MRALRLARMATIVLMVLITGLLIWPASVTLAWHPRWSVTKDCYGWEAKVDPTYTENGVTYRGEVRERQNMKGNWSPGQTSVTARAYVVWPGHDQGWFSVKIDRPTENCVEPSPTPTSPPSPTATPVPPTATPTSPPPAATATPTTPPGATATPTSPPDATATPTAPPAATPSPTPQPTKVVDQPPPTVTPTQPANPVAPTATPRRRSSRPGDSQSTPTPAPPATATPVAPVTEPAVSPPAATPTAVSEVAPIVVAPLQRQHEAEAGDSTPQATIIPAGLPRTGGGGAVDLLPLATVLALLAAGFTITRRPGA